MTSVPKAFLFVCFDILLSNDILKCDLSVQNLFGSLRLVTFVTDCFGIAVSF